MLYCRGFAFPEGIKTETATKPITSANGTMAKTELFFYQQCHATVKTGLVSDYWGARVITVHISNTVFGCMHYIAIHTQWHSGLLLHQNYVILHDDDEVLISLHQVSFSCLRVTLYSPLTNIPLMQFNLQ